MKNCIKLFIIVFMTITITGCGSGKEGDASKYDINETNIEFVTAPSQEYIVSVLYSNQYIDDIEPVTANNDPNGKLGKEDGYYSAVFFTSNLVNYDKKQTPIDNGTDGGGCIELFKTEEDAISREKTVAKFKSSGGHVRLGTVIVRTSSLLNDQDQNKLEESICNALLNGNNYSNNESEEIDNPGKDEEIEIIYPDNKMINYFIVKYNSIYPDSSLEEGDFYKYSHHGKTEDDRIHFYEEKHEILVSGPSEYNISKGSRYISIMISYRPKVTTSEEDWSQAFIKYARVFSPELTDETLTEYWKKIVDKDDSVHGVEFNEFTGKIDNRSVGDYFDIVSVTLTGELNY